MTKIEEKLTLRILYNVAYNIEHVLTDHDDGDNTVQQLTLHDMKTLIHIIEEKWNSE